MLLNVIFISWLNVALASEDFSEYLDMILRDKNESEFYHRESRASDKQVYPYGHPYDSTDYVTCDQMPLTAYSPFVVLLLYRTSGRFVGMGSIIEKSTIITAAMAVSNHLHSPHEIFVLAGRLGPWWGKNSQVQRAIEIFVNDIASMALVRLANGFKFGKFVAPIRLPMTASPNLDQFAQDYGNHYAIFGVPRSSFDIPGEPTPKSSMYLMKVETLIKKDDQLKKCTAAFKGADFNKTMNLCTIANGTFCWGCVGSPTIAISKQGTVLQVATLTRATTTTKDEFHHHTRIAPFDNWIRSYTYIGFKDDLIN